MVQFQEEARPNEHNTGLMEDDPPHRWFNVGIHFSTLPFKHLNLFAININLLKKSSGKM
jgi:hypothetical protein